MKAARNWKELKMGLEPLRGGRAQFILFVLCTIMLFASGGHEPMAWGNQAGSRAQTAEIDRLIAVLRDKGLLEKEPEVVEEAIEELGRLRAVAAVDDLVNLLTFERPFEGISPELRGHLAAHLAPYPATTALFEIGKPALPALVAVIAGNEIGSLEFRNARYTVMLIFRDDLPAGSTYVREEATKASSPEGRRRLLAAAQWIDELHAKSEAQGENPE